MQRIFGLRSARACRRPLLNAAVLGVLTALATHGNALAADLTPAPPASAPPVAASQLPFFVKLGFSYVINSSSSKLYSEFAPGSAQLEIPGVGANISNEATLGVEAGYFVTPNVSIDVSAGWPMWVNVTTKGAPPGGGPPPGGAELSSIMSSFVPITALYHFDQFGAIGLISAPVSLPFSLSRRETRSIPA